MGVTRPGHMKTRILNGKIVREPVLQDNKKHSGTFPTKKNNNSPFGHIHTLDSIPRDNHINFGHGYFQIQEIINPQQQQLLEAEDSREAIMETHHLVFLFLLLFSFLIFLYVIMRC